MYLGLTILMIGIYIFGFRDSTKRMMELEPKKTEVIKLIMNDTVEAERFQELKDSVYSTNDEIIREYFATETPMIEITQTPYPTFTPYPEMRTYIYYDSIFTWGNYVPETKDWEVVQGILSFYYPPYGGINCRDGINCDTLANGESWLNQVGLVVACPNELPFGTLVEINGGLFICKDRGNSIIKTVDNKYWFDVLVPYIPGEKGYWGKEIEVRIKKP